MSASSSFSSDKFYDSDEFAYDSSTIDLMNNWETYAPAVQKDLEIGDAYRVLRLYAVDTRYFSVECEGGFLIDCSLKKERSYFNSLGYDFTNNEFYDWLTTDEAAAFFSSNDVRIVTYESPYSEEILGSMHQLYLRDLCGTFLKEIEKPRTVYNARVLRRTNGGFEVSVNGIPAFLPGSLAAANRIFNFEQYVGSDIRVMIEDYIKESSTFIVSNKKYIEYVLDDRLKELELTRAYKGQITGFGESKRAGRFGIFIEFDGIFTGLLHVSEMNKETLDAFTENRYEAGGEIEFYIKEIKRDKKIILTSECGGVNAFTLEDFKAAHERGRHQGRITSIKPYGCFIKFDYGNSSFTGLLRVHDCDYEFMPQLGARVEVFIAEVNVETQKLYLTSPVIVETRRPQYSSVVAPS